MSNHDFEEDYLQARGRQQVALSRQRFKDDAHYDSGIADHYRNETTHSFWAIIFIAILSYIGFVLAIGLFLTPVHAAEGFPQTTIAQSCATFAAIPRALANCESSEVYYRAAASARWVSVSGRDRDQCAELMARAPRNKFQVLDRCLRVSISESEWRLRK